MIAFVRGVIAASTRSTSIVKSSSRTSTRTGRAPGVEDAVGAGDERERHGDHLVARTDVVAEQREVQCRRPRAGGDGVGHADHRGERVLELGDARSLGEHAGVHRLPDALLLLLAHLRASDRDHSDRLL